MVVGVCECARASSFTLCLCVGRSICSSSSSSSRDNLNTWPLSLRPSPHSIGIYTYFKGLQCMLIMIFLIKVIYQSSSILLCILSHCPADS